MLVPEVAQGAAAELADLLATCDEAVAALLQDASGVVVVGPGPASQVHLDGASGTLAGFGVGVRAGSGAPADLPLSLTIGAWLLDRAGAAVRRLYVEVGPAAERLPVPGTGADAVLVMGDGTARLTERAPGGADPAAAGYDDSVVAALGSGDPALLAALDLAEGRQQMAGGVPAWRAVGAALGERAESWTATVLAREAPYGVSYVVARWQ